MTIEAASLLTVRLLTFSLFLQAIEVFILSRKADFQHIWSYANLAPDLERGLPLPADLTRKLFSTPALQKIAILQVLVSLITFFHAPPAFVLILFFTHLLICIRFRGSFNGGSDMMTFVVLTGALIAVSGYAKIGLIYIAIHTLYSYFKAGLAKAWHREWWNGNAISVFLSRSLFWDIKKHSNWFSTHRSLSAILGWSTIQFEFAALLLLLRPQWVYLYFGAAILFHLLIYFIFGLNRFFWIWLSAWPATIYALSLISI